MSLLVHENDRKIKKKRKELHFSENKRIKSVKFQKN